MSVLTDKLLIVIYGKIYFGEINTSSVKLVLVRRYRCHHSPDIKESGKIVGLLKVEFIYSVTFCLRNILKIPNESDYTSIVIYRHLGCPDIPDTSMGYTMSRNLLGHSTLSENTILISPEGFKGNMPSHLLVSLSDKIRLALKAVIIHEFLIGTHKSSLLILPEHSEGSISVKVIPEELLGKLRTDAVIPSHGSHIVLISGKLC